MTLTIVPLAMTPEIQRILVLAILVLLGLGMVAAAGIFGYSIWKQRKYNTTALPSLGGDAPSKTEEEETDAASAFALDLVRAEPISKNAYATRLDEDAAFVGMTPHSDLIGQAPAPPPRPTVRPEAALPLLPETSPVDDLDDLDDDYVLPPLSAPPASQQSFKRMELGGPEPDEFPEWESKGNYELTPELEAAASPRAARDLDEDEDLDFTPVISKDDSSSANTRESRKLRMPPVDKIDSVISSSNEDEIDENQYVGKRSDPTPTDPNAL